MSRSAALPLVALTALGAAVRFATLDVQSFGFDEAVTVGNVLNGSLGHAMSTLPDSESTPPLYYLLGWFWTQPLGTGEVGIRALSALAGAAAIPVAYAAARDLASRRAGIIAAALVAVNPFLVFYSQEARAYSLLSLFGLLSFWAFARCLREPSPRRFALWVAASAAALLTHYFALFVVVPEALWLLLGLPAQRRQAAVAVAGAGAVAVGLLPLALAQSDGRTDWISGEALGTRTKQVVSKFVVGEVDPTTNALLLAIGIACVLLGVYAFRRLSAADHRALGVAAGIGGAGIALPLALDAVLPGFDYLLARNMIASLPILAVGAGILLAQSGTGAVGPAAAAVLSAGMLGVVIAGALDPRLQRLDFRSAAEAVGGDATVVVAPYAGKAPLELYLPGSVDVPDQGVLTRTVAVLEPVRRRDSGKPARPATPVAPAGFQLRDRLNARTFTRIRYVSAAPRPVTPGGLQGLVGRSSLGPPTVLKTAD